MTVGPAGAVHQARRALETSGLLEDCRLLCYPSDEYPGRWYLKIYRRQATKLNTAEVLRRRGGYAGIRTVGSVPGAYHICVPDARHDAAVRRLKEEFEQPYLPGVGWIAEKRKLSAGTFVKSCKMELEVVDKQGTQC